MWSPVECHNVPGGEKSFRKVWVRLFGWRYLGIIRQVSYSYVQQYRYSLGDGWPLGKRIPSYYPPNSTTHTREYTLSRPFLYHNEYENLPYYMPTSFYTIYVGSDAASPSRPAHAMQELCTGSTYRLKIEQFVNFKYLGVGYVAGKCGGGAIFRHLTRVIGKAECLFT